MEYGIYIYAILLLKTLNKVVTEGSVKNIVEAAGSKVDDKKVQETIKKMKKRDKSENK